MPQWNTVSISGYHIREAGSTAVQELAFTLADGLHYVEECLGRDMEIDRFAKRLSFFFNAHNDLFEEVAKYRAARSLWADVMRNRFGAKDEASWKLRFHAQTAGCSLQDRQPEVNLIRVAYQALAAVMGGCQSLHSNSMDETLALPSEHAVTLALRTQQVLAYETGVPNTPDPLGGSYFVETLTEQMRRQAEDYFEQIKEQGGMLAAIGSGFFRREIAESAFAYQKAVDSRQKLIVGVNAFQEDDSSRLIFCRSTKRPKKSSLATSIALSRTATDPPCGPALDQLKRAAERKTKRVPGAVGGGECPRDGRRSDERTGRSPGTLRTGWIVVRTNSQAQRIVLAKIGLDGHDRGVKVVARGLRDAGFHVIYAGLWQPVEAVVQTVLDEDADWLGISLLSGASHGACPAR